MLSPGQLAGFTRTIRPWTGRAIHRARGETAGKKFKNVQVLKDVPADQLIPSMQFISASLGVECDFCHVENAGKMEFDKDDKEEKKIRAQDDADDVRHQPE